MATIPKTNICTFVSEEQIHGPVLKIVKIQSSGGSISTMNSLGKAVREHRLSGIDCFIVRMTVLLECIIFRLFY